MGQHLLTVGRLPFHRRPRASLLLLARSRSENHGNLLLVTRPLSEFTKLLFPVTLVLILEYLVNTTTNQRSARPPQDVRIDCAANFLRSVLHNLFVDSV
jgi:hypothetical protein